MTIAKRGSAESQSTSAGLRTLLTLAIIFHVFFALVAVSSNFAPSELQFQILSKFRFYTRLLNFDLNFTPYHLTHATEADVDHRIEVLPEGRDGAAASDWLLLSGGFRGSDSYKRYQRLASIWAFQAQNEGEPALFAQAVGTHVARQRAIKPKQIRCRRHFLQPRNAVEEGTPAQRNPNDPSYFAVVYAANAIVSDTGFVEVVRVDEAGQVAQPTNRQGQASGPNNNESGR